MTSRDFYDEPFDEGTLIKLEIFENYFEEWLPTFVGGKFKKPIQVFDLFAGIGYDQNGQEGSPIRILKVINKFRNLLEQKNKKVNVFLNDIDQNKFKTLKSNIEEKIEELSIDNLISLTITNKSFTDCLQTYQNQLSYGFNLLYIDQNGFKEINKKIFQSLIRLDTTDFIFFISSSFIHRFANTPEVQKIHPNFDFNKIQNTHRKLVHNVICEEYQKYVPSDVSNYLLIPFSIMKSDKNNVYGLIFVCKHILAADKFLDVVWKMNPTNGSANFDIDDDLTKSQLHLFNGKIPTKIEKFQYELKENILQGKIKNNKEAYIFTINQGHIPQHAHEIIEKMKKDNLIDYDSKSPLVNYDNVCKKNRILYYKVLNENH